MGCPPGRGTMEGGDDHSGCDISWQDDRKIGKTRFLYFRGPFHFHPLFGQKTAPKPGPKIKIRSSKKIGEINFFFRCTLFLGVVWRPNPGNIDPVGPLLNAALSNRIETRFAHEP